MATDESQNYYVRWVLHAFRGPWGVASLVGSILALVVPAVVRFVPALRAWTAAMNDLLWQVPLLMLGLLVTLRLVTTPRTLHMEETKRAEASEQSLREVTERHRASIVVSRVVELVEDDPNADGPYANEYLRFSNVGPESALTIRIEPITLGDREISLWEPIDLIRPGEHTDRMPRGGLAAGFQRLRKARDIDFREEVRVPLMVTYTDRHGGQWRTPHAVVFQGNDVRIEPIRSVSDVFWTDIGMA